MTPLDKTLKRAITIQGDVYVITLSPEALKLSRKGHRLGVELKWAELVSGESALAVALQASLGRFEQKDLNHRDRLPAGASQSKTHPRSKIVKGVRRASGRRMPPKRSR